VDSNFGDAMANMSQSGNRLENRKSEDDEVLWKTEEVKMTRCPEECEKQWRPV